MDLQEIYRLKLLDYHMNGIKEQPDRLLAVLLLPDIYKYDAQDQMLYFMRLINNKLMRI